MTLPDLRIRTAVPSDHEALEQLRLRAFAPVFASFRSILGDDIYERAQRAEDEAQADILAGLFAPDSDWRVSVAETGGVITGFVSWRESVDSGVGEIGLNAVDPDFSGQGIGTRLYEFALQRMRTAGMRVATVATGGDPAHAPARRAYRKAGFDVSIPSLWMCRKL